MLQESAVTADPDELARRVALGDRVRLVSPQDPDDWYELELVLPPDTGYDLETANELYAAEATVLDGTATPADALAALDERLGR